MKSSSFTPILIVVLTIVAVMLFGMTLANLLTGHNLLLNTMFFILSLVDFAMVYWLVTR